MKCFYKAKVIKDDGSEHNVTNSFDVYEDEAKAVTKGDSVHLVIIDDYTIRCHALVDNFQIGHATGTDNVTILDWELLT